MLIWWKLHSFEWNVAKFKSIKIKMLVILSNNNLFVYIISKKLITKYFDDTIEYIFERMWLLYILKKITSSSYLSPIMTFGDKLTWLHLIVVIILKKNCVIYIPTIVYNKLWKLIKKRGAYIIIYKMQNILVLWLILQNSLSKKSLHDFF